MSLGILCIRTGHNFRRAVVGDRKDPRNRKQGVTGHLSPDISDLNKLRSSCSCQNIGRRDSSIYSDHYLPTVILIVILIIIGIPSPTHSFTLGLNPSFLPFLQILPTAPFPFSHSGFTIWISQTVYCYFWAYASFYFLVFLLLHFFKLSVPCGRLS